MCHVLIIEDEPMVALDLQDLFEREGATSFAFAASEREAIASAIEYRPALITSDVKLVHGTGPKAVAAIHKKLGSIPVIFITASPEACEPCEPPGIVINKPLDARAIVAAFHRFVNIERSSWVGP